MHTNNNRSLISITSNFKKMAKRENKTYVMQT